MLRDYCERTVALALIFQLLFPCLTFGEGDKGAANGGIVRDVIPEILPPAVKEGAIQPGFAIIPPEVDF
ncbi:MAG TPA: hypothetical protein VJZ16_00145, partial [Syntrophales bacterium]|nr:hypothetical protein [Syntrophales bacterium]